MPEQRLCIETEPHTGLASGKEPTDHSRHPSTESPHGSEPVASERPRTTILVADDEPSIVQLVRRIMEEAGYSVLTARNGREAIDTVRKHRVDVLITDLVMPEREGIETIQELRTTHPNLKMIAMSGAFGGSYLHIAAMMGAVAALTKPLNAELLLNTVRTLLGR